MALYQLIYTSSLGAHEPEIFSAILNSSMRDNQRSDITGILLHADGNIMQELEGERDAVLEVFEAIELDTRHRDIFCFGNRRNCVKELCLLEHGLQATI